MKKIKGKRLFAFILTVCMCVGGVVFPVSAVTTDVTKIGGQEFQRFGLNGYSSMDKEGKLKSLANTYVLNTGHYEVTKNTKLIGPAGKSPLAIRGDVTIYIAPGAVLTCLGGCGKGGRNGFLDERSSDRAGADGGSGGGAGIELLSGSKLTLIGGGRVEAIGGKGGTGGAASSGSNGYFLNKGFYSAGVGGSGAGGAGGGGAGIGSPGARGGDGGISPLPVTNEAIPLSKNENDPQTGGNGQNGAAVQSPGCLIVKDNVSVAAFAGEGSTGGTSGDAGQHHSHWYSPGFFTYYYYVSAGGGGGGAGGDSGAGEAFGRGGTAGGGGASGNTGGLRWCANGRENTYIAGGRGGSAGENGNGASNKGRAPDARCGDGDRVPLPGKQGGGSGGKASEFLSGNSATHDNMAYFTPTAHAHSYIKKRSLIPADNTALDINLDGKIEKKTYLYSKRELPNIVKEGYTCTGWFDEKGNKVADETGKMLTGSGQVWDLWGDRSFHSDLERIKDADYINEELRKLGTVTIDKIEKIEELRKAYDVLTPEEKEKVTQYQTLLDAEMKVSGIIDVAVEQMISDITNIGPVDLTKEDKINEIRKKYDQLPEIAKQKIPADILKKFTDAEKELDRQQQEIADQLIGEIIGIDGVDFTKEVQIKEIRKKYDRLSKGTQQKIPEEVKNILTEAEGALKQLHWKAVADQMAEEIKGIGTVDLTKEVQIKEIRKKYDSLSEEIKIMIPEEVKVLLTEAEEELEIQKQAVADQMIEQIKGIGAVDLTKEDKISEIRKKYNQLPEDIKKKIPEEVKKILTQAEQQVEEIKNQESAQPEKPVIQGEKVGTKVVDTKTKGKYKVSKSDEKTKEVQYTGPTSKKLKAVKIPDTIVIKGITYKVTSIAKDAFKNNKYLQKAIIGKNIKKIDKKAFYGCKKLKSVTLGKEITVIEDDAFKNCTSLTKITIPSKVTKIDQGAFYGCKKLKKITIKSKKLKTVGKNAIKNIDKKAYIDVPKSKVKAYKKLFKSKTGYKKSMKLK